MNFLRNKLIYLLIILVLLGVSFYFGFIQGSKQIPGIEAVKDLSNKEEGMPEQVDFSPFWKAWNIINNKFVSVKEEEIAVEDKVWGAIVGLANSLGDPYTQFLPPAEAEYFQENIKGEFGGVGMEVGIRDGVLTVVSPLKDSPAEKAGVRTGDKIIQIDGEISAEMTVDKAVQQIRGEIGTEVKLTILRENIKEPFDISITRDNIKIPTIDTELRDDGIFVISLYSFNAPSANLFRESLQEFINSGSSRLIIDLRGNPGGFLESAIDMASWFLEAGKIVVTEDFGKRGTPNEHRSKGYNVFNENLKLIILMDGGSASASEILAGALKDHGKATIVGTQSFGKGSVQELIEITPETSLKVTIAKWLTPNGVSISENGITPDVLIERTVDDYEADVDPQLDEAIKILNK